MKALTPILAPLSAVYGAVTRSRVALYRRGLLRVSRLKQPVISVGNLTAGGTGKTPLVEYVALALAGRGKRVCVLTRGYGRRNAGQRILVSDGERILANEIDAGDEPFLLAEKLLGVAAVICDANRFAAGDWAAEKLGAEVFVLDDGFQYLSLDRNLDIVTIDASRPWGQSHLLPWGQLREPTRELARADCVVITRDNLPHDAGKLQEEISRLVSDKPVFTSHMEIRGVMKLHEKSAKVGSMGQATLNEIVRPIAAFCGIGNPGSFFSILHSAGCDPVTTIAFPDHHKYTENDIAGLVREAETSGAKSLITTAKDAVKLSRFSFNLSCYVLDIKVSIDDESRFEHFLYCSVAATERLPGLFI